MPDPAAETPPVEPVPAPEPPAPTITDKDRLDYYWKHFALIADQRVKTFNFYIIVLLASFGATVGAFKQELPRHLYCLIGIGHVVIVLVFWMIEHRGRVILNIDRTALREIENSAFGPYFKPMSVERKNRFKIITYGRAFFLIFIIHFVFGLCVAWKPETLMVPEQQQDSNK